MGVVLGDKSFETPSGGKAFGDIGSLQMLFSLTELTRNFIRSRAFGLGYEVMGYLPKICSVTCKLYVSDFSLISFCGLLTVWLSI